MEEPNKDAEANEPKKPVRSEFDAEWKDRPFVVRGFKYLFDLPPGDERIAILEECRVRFRDGVRQLIGEVHVLAEDGARIRSTKSESAKKFLDEKKPYLEDKLGLHSARLQRSAVHKSVEINEACIERFKCVPDTPPRLRNERSTHFKDGPFRDTTPSAILGVMKCRLHDDIEIELPYRIPKGMLNKKKVKDGSVEYDYAEGEFFSEGIVGTTTHGGNLVKKEGKTRALDRFYYACSASVPFKWAYVPKTQLGFDLNLEGRFFIVCSDGLTFEQTPQMLSVIERLQKLNADTKTLATDRVKKPKGDKTKRWKLAVPKGGRTRAEKVREEYDRRAANKGKKGVAVNTGERRGVRRKIERAHRRLAKLVHPICTEILDRAVATRAVVCIDGLSVGDKTGTFGHEKVIAQIKNECYRRRIPYVVVPTFYTSKTHHECQKLGVEVSKAAEDRYYCRGCRVHFSAHFDASKNIAAWGRRIWDDGLRAFGKWLKDNKITKEDNARVTREWEAEVKAKNSGHSPSDCETTSLVPF